MPALPASNRCGWIAARPDRRACGSHITSPRRPAIGGPPNVVRGEKPVLEDRRMAALLSQNKSSEIALFDGQGASDAYNVFSPETNERVVDIVLRLSGLPKGARIADLGCGSGVFSNVL